MVRLIVMLSIFELFSLACYSQKLVFKEYVKVMRGSRKTFISQVSNGIKKQCECPVLSSIWKFDAGKYYSMMDNKVLILNENCEVQDSVVFEEPVIDFSLHGDLLLASTTTDEVEYYSSRMVRVSLTDKTKRELYISSEGFKFGLNISDNAQFFSFIQEDGNSGVQKLMIYRTKDGELIEVDRQIKELICFGNVGSPAQSYWIEDCLYYETFTTNYDKTSLSLFDVKTSRHKKLRDLSSDYSLAFKISKDGNNMIVLKRSEYDFKSIVSLNIETGTEKVLYTSTVATLSDIDDFAYIEK